MVLWQGKRLTIESAPISELVASKLIRYDEIDQGDIQYLCSQSLLSFADVEEAVRQLPSPFCTNSLVLENLGNLQQDLAMWRGES